MHVWKAIVVVRNDSGDLFPLPLLVVESFTVLHSPKRVVFEKLDRLASEALRRGRVDEEEDCEQLLSHRQEEEEWAVEPLGMQVRLKENV